MAEIPCGRSLSSSYCACVNTSSGIEHSKIKLPCNISANQHDKIVVYMSVDAAFGEIERIIGEANIAAIVLLIHRCSCIFLVLLLLLLHSVIAGETRACMSQLHLFPFSFLPLPFSRTIVALQRFLCHCLLFFFCLCFLRLSINLVCTEQDMSVCVNAE